VNFSPLLCDAKAVTNRVYRVTFNGGSRLTTLDFMDDEAGPRRNTTASESNERLQFALDVARMGVFEWNPNSDLTWASGTTGLGLNQKEAPTSGRAFFRIRPS
jgi:hypothetical protein